MEHFFDSELAQLGATGLTVAAIIALFFKLNSLDRLHHFIGRFWDFDDETWDICKGTNIKWLCMFCCVAIVSSFIMINFAVYSFAHVLLEYNIFASLALSTLIAGAIFLVERFLTGMLLRTLATNRPTSMKWLIGIFRVIVLMVLLVGGFIEAAVSFRTAVEAKMFENKNITAKGLMDSKYKAELSALNAKINDASTRAVQIEALETELTTQNKTKNNKQAIHDGEVDGSIMPDVSGNEGDGDLAKGAQHLANEASANAISLNEQIGRLGSPSSDLKTAKEELTNLNKSIDAEASAMTTGATQYFRAFFSLIPEQGMAAWFPIIGWMLFTSIFEILMWAVFLFAGVMGIDGNIATQLELKRQEIHREIVGRYSKKMPLLEVKWNTSKKENDTKPVDGSNGGAGYE